MEINVTVLHRGSGIVTVGLEYDGLLIGVIDAETFIQGFEFWMKFLNNRR